MKWEKPDPEKKYYYEGKLLKHEQVIKVSEDWSYFIVKIDDEVILARLTSKK